MFYRLFSQSLSRFRHFDTTSNSKNPPNPAIKIPISDKSKLLPDSLAKNNPPISIKIPIIRIVNGGGAMSFILVINKIKIIWLY